MASTLTTDTYIIRSLSSKDGEYVGRSKTEDFSLGPKRVIALPQGIQAPEWIIEQLPSKRYRLRIGGAPTGVQNDLVFAFLLEGMIPEEWVIERIPQAGENAFTISKHSGPEGWVLPDTEPGTQVACKVYPVGQSLPPKYPSNALWNITRAHPK